MPAPRVVRPPYATASPVRDVVVMAAPGSPSERAPPAFAITAAAAALSPVLHEAFVAHTTGARLPLSPSLTPSPPPTPGENARSGSPPSVGALAPNGSVAPSLAVVVVAGTTAEPLLCVLEYLEHHAAAGPGPIIPKPVPVPIDACLCEWDRSFVFLRLLPERHSTDTFLLSETLIAADYLGVVPLVELCAAVFASMVRLRHPSEIRELLGVANDLTEEVMNKMAEENKWTQPDPASGAAELL